MRLTLLLVMLQSLAFEPTYRSAYCMAVCPAGEDVMGGHLADKAQYRERVYVQSGHLRGTGGQQEPGSRCGTWSSVPMSPPSRTSPWVCAACSPRPGTLPDKLRIAFRFPGGTLLATVENGRLTTGPGDDLPVDAAVACNMPDYIRILHHPAAGRLAYAVPASYTVDGDSSALQHLLACLR